MNQEASAGADVELISDGDGDDVEVLALQTEIGTLRRRLQQREVALADLNRRLVALERGAGGDGATARTVADLRSQLTTARHEADMYRAEVDRLYATKLFRMASPARRVYSRLRGR